MALDYDIIKDLSVQQGSEESYEDAFRRGYQQGLKEGYEQGLKETLDKIILNLLKNGKLSMEEIAEVAELPLDYVKKIAEAL